MSVTVSVPKEGRIVVPVINASTTASISSGSIVKLSTASTPNEYKVELPGTTAGTVIRVFGVVEHAIGTAGTGYCVIHGPAVCMANNAITVKSPITAEFGTAGSGVRGRGAVMSIATAGAASTTKYAGWAIGPGSTGAFFPLFVNTPHTPMSDA